MMNIRGNTMCVVDVETTGLMFGYNEIIQLACLPLDEHLEPSKEHRYFYMNIAPEHPERQSGEARMKHGLDAFKLAEECVSQDRAAELLDEWFMSLNLPLNKRLVPIAQNWAFERGFLTHWLGLPTFDNMWYCHPRDTMLFANSINDSYSWRGDQVPFPSVGLGSLCSRMGIKQENAHDALADCIYTARVYKEMLRCFSG